MYLCWAVVLGIGAEVVVQKVAEKVFNLGPPAKYTKHTKTKTERMIVAFTGKDRPLICTHLSHKESNGCGVINHTLKFASHLV